jgi:hypothetical protein
MIHWPFSFFLISFFFYTKVAFRRDFAYGEEKRNRKHREFRMLRDGITGILEALKETPANHPTAAGYLAYQVRLWDPEVCRARCLYQFFGSKSATHAAWDTSMSLRSRTDWMCEFIERLGGDLIKVCLRFANLKASSLFLFN